MTPTTEESQIATVPLAVPPPPPQPDRRLTIEQLAMLGPMAADDRRVAWVNALVDADIQRQSYATDMALARKFQECGQFDDLKRATQEQAIATAMVKIQLGRAWGFNAADSMRNIYFVNGKPSLEQDIVASKLQQAGITWDPEFSYEDVTPKGGRVWRKCTGCTLWLKRWNVAEQKYQPMLGRDGKQVSVSFTLADAENAQTYEKGEKTTLANKATYQSFPGDMFYWRCISRVRKYYAPHVLRGGVLREEALEMIPTEAPPDQLPRELQPAPDDPPQPEDRRPLAERILDTEQQTLDMEARS